MLSTRLGFRGDWTKKGKVSSLNLGPPLERIGHPSPNHIEKPLIVYKSRTKKGLEGQ